MSGCTEITWYFFRLTDGVFDGRYFSAPDASYLPLNTPFGYGACSDVADWQSQRVNIASNSLEDYQPPQPDTDHVWVDRRWILRPEISERLSREQTILAELNTLDARLTRPLGELALDPNNMEARGAAEAIISQKQTLRSELQELRNR